MVRLKFRLRLRLIFRFKLIMRVSLERVRRTFYRNLKCGFVSCLGSGWLVRLCLEWISRMRGKGEKECQYEVSMRSRMRVLTQGKG